MLEIGPPCEAEVHAGGCNGIGSTKDHFTPRAVAKLLGWAAQQLGSPENLQHLSPACHAIKDRTTPKRMHLLEKQLQGREIKFGDHQRVLKEPILLSLFEE